MRENAALALGKIGDVRAVTPLIVALKDLHESVRTAAREALEALKSEPSDQSQQAQPVSKSEAHSAAALDAIPITAGPQHYSNRDWGFELDYPADWKIQVENDPAGSWTVAVIIVGDAPTGGKAGIIVNARRGPVLAGGGGGGFSQVYVIGSDGSSPQLPRTAHEFIEKAKKRFRQRAVSNSTCYAQDSCS